MFAVNEKESNEKFVDSKDDKFGERTILTRIIKIAEELNEREARGTKIPDIAREILKHQQFRPTLTLEVATNKSNQNGRRKGYIEQDGWVVIHPLPEDDDLARKGELSWHMDLAEAEETVREVWQEVDEELLSHLLHPAIVNVPTKDQQVEVTNLAGTLNTLRNFVQTGLLKDTVFPKKYPNKEAFEKHVKVHQQLQLDELNHVINTPDLLTRKEGILHLRSKDEWNMMGPNRAAYPDLPAVKGVRITPDITVQRLLFIEDYLFGQDSEPVLHGLAKAHTVLGPAMGHPGMRKALNESGVRPGTPLPELIENMTKDGFDLQPIFDNDRCVGTIRLNDVVMSLQKYGKQALPPTVDVSELRKIGLLSPAPPAVDAHEPLVKVAEWLSSGLEAVLVYYSPKLWEHDSKQGPFIDEWIEEGWHIVTQHDIVACSMML